MSLDFQSKAPPGEVVVELRKAGVDRVSPYDAGLDDVSFTLRRGELALVMLESGANQHPLPDVISGLLPLECGAVEIFGRPWMSWNADTQARARGKIGRVFGRHGWLNNLDVDENMTLAERHHTRRAEADIYAEAHQLAELAGLPELPQTRPAVTPRDQLRRSEWVRAALGSPWLMILERPGEELAAGWLPRLRLLVQRVREGGGAVVWLCGGYEEWSDASLNPSLKLVAEKNKLRALGAS